MSGADSDAAVEMALIKTILHLMPENIGCVTSGGGFAGLHRRAPGVCACVATWLGMTVGEGGCEPCTPSRAALHAPCGWQACQPPAPCQVLYGYVWLRCCRQLPCFPHRPNLQSRARPCCCCRRLRPLAGKALWSHEFPAMLTSVFEALAAATEQLHQAQVGAGHTHVRVRAFVSGCWRVLP